VEPGQGDDKSHVQGSSLLPIAFAIGLVIVLVGLIIGNWIAVGIGAVIAFANLQGTTAFLAVFIGILVGIAWIVEGAITLAQLGDSPSRGWAIFFGLLSIVAGIVLLFSPLWGIVVLFLLAGISLIVLGIVQIVRAITFGRGVATPAS